MGVDSKQEQQQLGPQECGETAEGRRLQVTRRPGLTTEVLSRPHTCCREAGAQQDPCFQTPGLSEGARATNKIPRTEALKLQKFIFPQFSRVEVQDRSSLASISVHQPTRRGNDWVYLTLMRASVLGPLALAQQLSEVWRIKAQAHSTTIYPLPSFPSSQLEFQRKWLSGSQFSQHLAETVFKKINGPQPRLLLSLLYVFLHAIFT